MAEKIVINNKDEIKWVNKMMKHREGEVFLGNYRGYDIFIREGMMGNINEDGEKTTVIGAYPEEGSGCRAEFDEYIPPSTIIDKVVWWPINVLIKLGVFDDQEWDYKNARIGYHMRKIKEQIDLKLDKSEPYFEEQIPRIRNIFESVFGKQE